VRMKRLVTVIAAAYFFQEGPLRTFVVKETCSETDEKSVMPPVLFVLLDYE